jgi:hypothetical protein
MAEKISCWIKGDKHDSLKIDCMNNLGIYTTTVHVESKFSKWVQKIGKISKKFNPEDVYNVKVYAINPPSGIIEGAVYTDNNEIILDLNKVLDYDMFGLEVSYRMDTEWLSRLVSSRNSPEPLENALRYNLSAQLKDPHSLVKGFSEFEVEEFPVIARVHIQENINLNIPDYIKKLTKLEKDMLEDYNPRDAINIINLQRERARLKKDLGKEDLMTKLNQFSVFLRPQKFINYITNIPGSDFRLHNCVWGELLFRALGLVSLPKVMNVTSRTDLSLKKPAASGKMIYESGKFSTDIKKFFDE